MSLRYSRLLHTAEQNVLLYTQQALGWVETACFSHERESALYNYPFKMDFISRSLVRSSSDIAGAGGTRAGLAVVPANQSASLLARATSCPLGCFFLTRPRPSFSLSSRLRLPVVNELCGIIRLPRTHRSIRSVKVNPLEELKIQKLHKS